MTTSPKPRFIPYSELRSRYGETRSRQQIRRDIENGLYPAPKQMSEQRIAFDTVLLDRHYDNLPTVDYAPAAKKGRVA